MKKAIAGGKAIGSGQCVDLCRFLSGAPNSGSWVAGKHVADLTDADIGTAIATFDSSGHYPSDNDPLGKNSAIFMGRGDVTPRIRPERNAIWTKERGGAMFHLDVAAVKELESDAKHSQQM